MDYAILIYGTEGTFERLPPDKQEEAMKGHYTLQAALEKRGAYGTVKLMPTTSAVTLRPTSEIGEKPTLMDGPFAETKERFLGIYMAQFDTLDEAISFTEMISSPYVSLEIRPIAWAGGVFGAPE
ncbi:YciI family protein [Pararhizobium sp. IMCC21322]|uniref:YciI family protein n=1 Tax=Pararhizobium sp. IMCC21322 TaxID=3067903 RepID=UPI002741E1AB|nr:YciI family protein [Pararhizobium sp. IMCC21322]